VKRSMLPEAEWSTLFELFASVDGDGAALLRVVRKSLPAVSLGFVPGGIS